MSRTASRPARSSAFRDGTFNTESPERKVGKTCDLAFGYQGGLNAWRKFEPDRFRDAEVEQFKLEWRAAHPQIKKFWYGIDRATWQAVRQREHVSQLRPAAAEMHRHVPVHQAAIGAQARLSLPAHCG